MALHAFIDESGQLAHTRRSSDHFILTAVVCRDSNLVALDRLLAGIREELGRRENDRLAWKRIRKQWQRDKASMMIGAASFLRIVSVVVCKRHLGSQIKDQDEAYLKTFQYLLQRLSWLGRRHETQTHYTLSHIKNFEVKKLPLFEADLRRLGTTAEISWDHLDPLGGRVSNDQHTPRLQIADLAASATAKAFEHDRTPLFGKPADQTFLLNLLPAYMRGHFPDRANVLTSYGLKMHPWNTNEVKADYPWVLPLR